MKDKRFLLYMDNYFFGPSASEIREDTTKPANRFMKVIKEIFESSKRGKKLTAERRDLLRKWERSSRRRGVTIEGIKKLESMLQRRIQLLESDGTVVYPGVNKYLKCGAIMKIYRTEDGLRPDSNKE